MPMLVGELLEERRSAASVNALIEASSITALTWFSNSTGSTMTFCGIALNSAEPIGTACGRHVGDQHAPLVGGALADQAFADARCVCGWPSAPSSA